MARDRVNTGLGPSYLTLTAPTSSVATTLASTWFRYGPCRSTNLAYMGVFTLPASSSGGPSTSIAKVRFQGRLTSGSTKGQIGLAILTSTNPGQVYGSTSSTVGVFGFLRALSTFMPTTGGSSSAPTFAYGSVSVTFAAAQ
jgi:hypothetical protein